MTPSSLCASLLLLLLRSACSTEQRYEEAGLQQLSRLIWHAGPTGSTTGALDALDAILVVLNSRKLHKRQAPATCPYCPTGYPCAAGCPPAPPVTFCDEKCSGETVQGPPGPPGQPGAPGSPVYESETPGCPGPSGQSGPCITGSPGPNGIPGKDCPRPQAVPLPNIDPSEVQGLLLQYIPTTPVIKCQHTVEALTVRLHRIDGRLALLDGVKQRLAALAQQLAAYRTEYIAKRVPGRMGGPGSQGAKGIKGDPGYDGVMGKCLPSRTSNPQPPGLPGIPGPKGEPGIPGDKICGCPGDIGDNGVVGPSLVGSPGPKGYKGAKGTQGANRVSTGSSLPPSPVPVVRS